MGKKYKKENEDGRAAEKSKSLNKIHSSVR